MADVRPFAALRYDVERAGPLAGLLAPPYDVIDLNQRERLAAESPYNIVRVELAKPAPGDADRPERYAEAAAVLSRWRQEGVLRRDEREHMYVYEQEFEFEGRRWHRTALLARVRLGPWAPGAVLPHEHTRPPDKADRLALLRATRTNVSPVFMLFRDPGDVVAGALAGAGLALAEAHSGYDRHCLRILPEPIAARLEAFFRGQTLYVADGHHRYETALAYCQERRAAAAQWTGEEPENFVLAALVSASDPGLLVRPTHRLVRPLAEPSDCLTRLARHFDITAIPLTGSAAAVAATLQERLRATRNGTAFGMVGFEAGRGHVLALKDPDGIDALLPRDKPPVWRSLDVSILQYAVLRNVFGIDEGSVAQGEVVDYTADGEKAVRAVIEGGWPLAFLLNPTPVGAVLAVADAGSRMPQKSTYFYPKLATGMALYAFD